MSDGFASEAAMVASWLEDLKRSERREKAWTVYPETAGWDLLLVHRDGYQLGIEAKLSLNAKVLCQAVEDANSSYWNRAGPDYRAVMVPQGKAQNHLGPITKALGLGIIEVKPPNCGYWQSIDLPDEQASFRSWPNWCPDQRCTLPDYVPDVSAGCAAPIQLTQWKIKAIKLIILLDRRGYVTRADMKALQINPSRWCDHFNGYLAPDPARRAYVRNGRTPNFRAEHPRNYVEIEADFDKWAVVFPDLTATRILEGVGGRG